ncbi:unnamed protein product, partial [Musa textilis]
EEFGRGPSGAYRLDQSFEDGFFAIGTGPWVGKVILCGRRRIRRLRGGSGVDDFDS